MRTLLTLMPSARGLCAPQRGDEGGLDEVEQRLVARLELVPLARAPDSQVAQRLRAVEGVQVDAPVQPVAREEVDEELGPAQLAVRHDLADRGRVTAALQLEGDRVVVLEPGRVAREVGVVHVQPHAVDELLSAGVPDEGGELVGMQQVQQREADLLAHRARVHPVGQQLEDASQRTRFGRGQMHRRCLRAP